MPDESTPDLNLKFFSLARTVEIGTCTLAYSLDISGPNVVDVARFERMFNGIMEQALSLIQHAYAPDHINAECLGAAFTPDTPGHGESKLSKEEEMLMAMKNLPQV